MGWNSKNEIIAILIAGGGFALVAVIIAAVFVPIIINIEQGGFKGIITIVILLALICSAIYLLRCRGQKNKKPKDERNQ